MNATQERVTRSSRLANTGKNNHTLASLSQYACTAVLIATVSGPWNENDKPEDHPRVWRAYVIAFVVNKTAFLVGTLHDTQSGNFGQSAPWCAVRSVLG